MYSLTQLGNLGQIFSFVLTLTGIEKAQADIQSAAIITTIGVAGHLLSFVFAWIGRYRHGDVTFFGFKKKK